MTTFVLTLMLILALPLAFCFAIILVAWFGYYER